MLPIPVFETDKILLRPFNPEDAPALYEYLSHPELAGRRYIPWKFEGILPLPQQDAAEIIKAWYENKTSFSYAVILKEGDALIGHVRADWGWDAHTPGLSAVISPPHQRKGYGTQACKLVLNYLFDFTVAHNVSNGIVEWNQSALAFARHLGFTHVGVRRSSDFHGGRFYDVQVYDILKPEWKEGDHAA